MAARTTVFLSLLVNFCLLALPVAGYSAEEDFSREDYNDYLELFNNNNPEFIKYYHPDVVLELGTSEIRGAQGIRDFYAEVKKHIKEEVTVSAFIADGDQLAVEIPTTFEVIEDWEDSFWGVPLEKGQVMRIISWGIYDIEDGKFKRIRTARYRMINDWQME